MQCEMSGKMKNIICILLIVSSVLARKPTLVSYKCIDNNIEIDTMLPRQRVACFSNKLYHSEVDYILKKFNPDSLERFTYNIELGVDSFGKVTSVNFMNVQKCNRTDSLLLELLLNMPRWTPAQSNGKNINSCVKFRIMFSPQ